MQKNYSVIMDNVVQGQWEFWQRAKTHANNVSIDNPDVIVQIIEINNGAVIYTVKNGQHVNIKEGY
jgi:hypothetical protein